MPFSYILEMLGLMLWRRRWLIVALVTLLGGAAAAFILTRPPVYVAQSKLLAKFGREHTLHSYGSGGEFVPVSYSISQIVTSAIEIMKADGLVAEVVDELGVDRLYPGLVDPDASGEVENPRIAAIQLMSEQLDIGQVGQSNIIVVELGNGDPEVASEALNRFVAAFQKKYAALHSEDLAPALEAEVALVADRVRRAEGAIADFERDTMVFSGDTQLDALFERQSELEVQLANLEQCCAGSSTEEELRSDLSQTNERIIALNAEKRRLDDLIRERDLAGAALARAQARLQDARDIRTVDQASGSSLQAISVAGPPIHPAGPSRTIQLAIALVLVTMFSLCVALTLEFLRRRYSTAAELGADTGLPVLAEISLVRS